DVCLRGPLNEVFVFGGPGLNIIRNLGGSGLNLIQKLGEFAELDIVDSAFDGTAVGMTQDEDEFCARDLAGEFHASADIVIKHVGGDAGVEDVADALVEEEFNRLA